MPDAVPPLRLEPHLSKPLWGGQKLSAEYGKGEPGSLIGESWEIYASDRVAAGPYQGRTLDDVASGLGEALLGSDGGRNYGGTFPLLIKLIDAAQQLSIQVHPNDAQAKHLERAPYGKTEAWHILRAEPGARLIYGLRRKLSAEELREHAASGAIEDDVALVEVEAGDSVLVPAGTVHSIGAGILLYEVQETSDTTYRLYDWHRKGPDGKTRELHLDKAAMVATLGTPTLPVRHRERGSPDREGFVEVLRCPYFRLERGDLGVARERDPGGRSFEALTVIDGAVSVSSVEDAWADEALGAGQSLLIPALSAAYRITPTREGGRAAVLISTVPPVS